MRATYLYHGPDEFSQSRHVVIDELTALWLARMAIGEGGEGVSQESVSAMVWAMLNRFFLHRARAKWPTFLYLVRRFSQPINPLWARGGKLAIKYANTKYTTEQKFERRERISSLQWADIPWDVEETIIAFEKGLCTVPASVLALERHRISDWASHQNLPNKFPWGIAFHERHGFNWFMENRNLIEGHVVIDYW